MHCRRSSAVFRSVYNFATFAVTDTASYESILACRSLLAEVRWTRTLSGFKVGGNACEPRSQARHFHNPTFRGLKQRFSRGNARKEATKIISWKCIFSRELIKLNLVKNKISVYCIQTAEDLARLEIQGPGAKLNGAHKFLQGPIVFIVPITLKLHLTSAFILLYTEQEAQPMLTTVSTRLAVSRGQRTWYHSTCYI